MIRNFKALGLALVAVLAMGAMVTSAAHGQGAAVLTSEGGTVALDGTQISPGEFVREARKVSCTSVSIESHDVNSDSTITTTAPIFGGCEETVLKKSSTVFMNGCVLVFHLIGDTKEPEDTWTATSDLDCPGSAVARLRVYNASGDAGSASDHEESDRLCEYTFGDQSGLGTVEITNIADTPNYLLLEIKVTGITSTRTFGAALTCGAVNNSTATLTAEAEAGGTDEEDNPTGITISTP